MFSRLWLSQVREENLWLKIKPTNSKTYFELQCDVCCWFCLLSNTQNPRPFVKGLVYSVHSAISVFFMIVFQLFPRDQHKKNRIHLNIPYIVRYTRTYNKTRSIQSKWSPFPPNTTIYCSTAHQFSPINHKNTKLNLLIIYHFWRIERKRLLRHIILYAPPQSQADSQPSGSLFG